MDAKILVVDDDQHSVEAEVEVLKREGYQVLTADSGRSAIKILESEEIDVVVTDLKMPDLNGLELLTFIRNDAIETQVIILTGFGSINTAVEAMDAGAFTYLQKPPKIQILRQAVRNALERRILRIQNLNLRERLDTKFGFDNLIGRSEPMINLFNLIRQVAPTNATVLITGENGVGKELIANAIHNHSNRSNKTFKAINCAAITPTLLESELFGHEKGSFTGATDRKLGFFEQSNGGTLFLDEIGEMSLDAQVRLLRVLEQHEFTRVGGDQTIKVDVRVIAATNKNLEIAVEKNEFRADLFHRINRFRVRVPPLRERREDIPLFVNVFIKDLSREHGKSITGITAEAMNYLKSQEWRGNVRELRNVIETAIILATDETIKIENLSTDFRRPNFEIVSDNSEIKTEPIIDEDQIGSVGMTMKEIEKEAIRKTLDETGGNKKKSAKILGIGVRTLYRKLEEFELSIK